MSSNLFYPIGTSAACRYAAKALRNFDILTIDHPSPEVTHLLLDVPSTSPPASIESILRTLPESVTVVGGRLPLAVSTSHPTIDLLDNEEYLIKNAALTAECALQVLLHSISFSLFQANILILGWGRIARPLCRCLLSLHANVFVCSRSTAHLSEAEILGASPIPPAALPATVAHMDAIINTAPAVLIPEDISRLARAVKIDLASSPGIEGDDVIHANGLPGMLKPISSGSLIAQTLHNHLEVTQ